jgi:acetylglutamate kinase
LGYVGEIVQVRAELIHKVAMQGMTAVISPISLGLDGQIYNVNADEAASAVALALNASRLNFVSNVPGVLQDERVIPTLTVAQAEQLIRSGVIGDGMVPKVRAALDAVSRGLPQARIVNLSGLIQSGGTTFSQIGD